MIHNAKMTLYVNMKTDFLVLPFYDSLKKTSLHDKAFYNSAPNVNFRIYCPFNELLPFVAPIQNCDFTLLVKDYTNEIIAQISSTQIKHKIVKKGNSKFIVFNGGIVNCIDLGSCLIPYYIQIENYYSEWFWVGDTTEMLKFKLGNSQDLLTVPYSLGFQQYFWLNTKFGTSEIDTYKVSSRDERGKTKTKFQQITENFNFYFFGVPAHIKQVFASFECLESVTVEGLEQSVKAIEKQITVKPKKSDENFSIYEIELTIPSDNQNTLSYCETPTFVYDEVCLGIENPISTNCIEINTILEIELNCQNETDLEEITVCCEDEIDFFATVTYN